MGFIWIMQTGFLEKYYQNSMEKRTNIGVKIIGSAYSLPKNLDITDFSKQLATLSRESDLYFCLKAVDDSFTISSNDNLSYGRMFMGGKKLVEDAISALKKSNSTSISYVFPTKENSPSVSPTEESKNIPKGENFLVNASIIKSAYRQSVYLIAVSPLTPLGPAVGIISTQLKLITIIALVLGALFACFYSKHISEPVTEIKNKAKELAKGNYNVSFDCHGYAEIEELASTLTYTAQELAKSDNLQKDLLANISHDLRTPLTMIKSYAELIRDISGDVKEKRDEHLQVIIEETDRLSDLVGDILALSKLQAGTEELENKPVDIQKAAESILNVYKVLEEQDGFKLNYEALSEKIYVLGDERKLQQVISNLLSNAVRYSGQSKNIEVSFTKKDNEIYFSVCDHGIGISEKDKERIWNRYQKASRQGTRAYGNSTGLGLSISKEILQRHKAHYGVESKEGEGSRFWFSLPIIEYKE